MASSNSSLTPVDRNTDFAAELVLNRVMNGQFTPESGRTINAASRHMGMRHDATAQTYDLLAENIAYGKTIVQGTENALTELKSQVEKIRDLWAVDDSSVRTQDIADSLKQNLDAILETEVNGVKILGGSNASNVGLGSDLTIGIDAVETIKIGGAAALNATNFRAFYNALTSPGSFASTPSAQGMELCNKAITELVEKIATQGQQYKILDNRYTMYNDLASSYHTFSDEQVVNMGGAMSVLESFS